MADAISFRSEWIEFEAELGFRPLITGPSADDIHKQDQQLGATLIKKYAAQFPPPDPSVVLREHSTPSKVRIKSYTPSNASPNKPAVCYFHGGGFVVGDVDRDDILVSRLAKDTGLVFASVEYRLAPQNPYPAGFNDCIDAAKWCIEHAGALGTNGTVVLMGGSAGATFALGTALKLIEDGELERLKGIVACQPMTLHPDAVPDQFRDQYSSYDEHATNTLNSAQGMRAFFDLHGASRTDPYIQCLHHPRLKDLPPTYINACEFDTLRDDARALTRTLDKLRVPNVYDEYAGLPHYFFVFPSPCLNGPRDEYHSKTAEGITFVLKNN